MPIRKFGSDNPNQRYCWSIKTATASYPVAARCKPHQQATNRCQATMTSASSSVAGSRSLITWRRAGPASAKGQTRP